ncbi:hypothetical protein BO70DRAFT_20690 [Aspergillus heteromorphus CBS 117.55]|uniref:Uncharacterized protein n=1 Tax=Aspergillus heteromorphus CBS 117.55 TaxID=1448321 RepID=A0A317X3F7_9EURO|nr:uncharacterized protein BO70DRAFT_20690 [Aspergillus heteromorphus CBS 117.55]PWY92875.1 hypothetical protein BO70DRAFT_20690 [Aspergillus heteromorphus CBS 117.55]
MAISIKRRKKSDRGGFGRPLGCVRFLFLYSTITVFFFCLLVPSYFYFYFFFCFAFSVVVVVFTFSRAACCISSYIGLLPTNLPTDQHGKLQHNPTYPYNHPIHRTPTYLPTYLLTYLPIHTHTHTHTQTHHQLNHHHDPQTHTHPTPTSNILTTLTTLTTLTLLLLLTPATARECYFPDGSVATENVPCSNATDAACCGRNDICLSNNLCMDVAEQPYVLSRGGCTDSTWESDSCPSVCRTYFPLYPSYSVGWVCSVCVFGY